MRHARLTRYDAIACRNRRVAVRASAIALALILLALPSRASAFERQWRVGGGAGVATLDGSEIGPAVGLHAAYGLSDYFDVHLELLGSRHGGTGGTDVGSASVGISYKIDVFQWVPYVGVYGGAYYYAGQPGPNGEHGTEAGASFGGGLDYLFSRSFAMGIGVRQHSSFREGLSFPSLSVLLRAEYRWGF